MVYLQTKYFRRVFQNIGGVLKSKGCIFIVRRIWSIISSLLSLYQGKSNLFLLCLKSLLCDRSSSPSFLPQSSEVGSVLAYITDISLLTLLDFVPAETVMKTRNTDYVELILAWDLHVWSQSWELQSALRYHSLDEAFAYQINGCCAPSNCTQAAALQ